MLRPIQNFVPVQNSNPEGINQYTHGAAGVNKAVADAKTATDKVRALHDGVVAIGDAALKSRKSMDARGALSGHLNSLLDGMSTAEAKAAAKSMNILRPLSGSRARKAIHDAVVDRLDTHLRVNS